MGSGAQVGWAVAVGPGVGGAVCGVFFGLPFAGAVGWVVGWARCVGLGAGLGAGGIMLGLSMFQALPLNCGAGNCWIGSWANADSANVCQICAGQ